MANRLRRTRTFLAFRKALTYTSTLPNQWRWLVVLVARNSNVFEVQFTFTTRKALPMPSFRVVWNGWSWCQTSV
jgi:hypothetical protein